MQAPASRRNPFPFFRPANPGWAESRAMLELFPGAVLIYQRSKGVITAANNRALTLTAYTQDELLQTPIERILPGFAGHLADTTPTITAPLAIASDLHTRSGSTQRALVSSIPLDTGKEWLFLTIELHSEQQSRKQRERRLPNMVKALSSIGPLLSSLDAAELCKTIATETQAISGAASIAIYQIDAQSPQLLPYCAAGTALPLPAALPLTDLGRIAATDLWRPGKRIRSSLHRLARASNLAYLATARIGEENAILGMIIAGGQEGSFDEDNLPVMDFMANVLASAFQRNVYETNLQHEQKRLSNSLFLRQTIEENVTDGIILLDSAFTIQEMNTSAEITLGYTQAEVRSQPIENVIIGADNLSRALLLSQEGIATPDLGNITLHRRDGRAFVAHLQLIPVSSPTGQPNVIMLLRDLSEQEHIRVRTQQLEQRALLGEVTAIFAHEVRNPINNISLNAQLLATNLPDGDENREMVERIRQDCDRLTHLMDSVLSFSRADEYHMQPLDLAIVIERLMLRWKPRMSRVNVDSEFHPGQEKLRIRGDEKALEQIFNNLFNNALRAMREAGGKLIVKLQRVSSTSGYGNVQIGVSDTGIGIPAETLPRIFNPFFTTDPQGTGLGLTITQRIIIAHKGNIDVESFPGGGTVFHIHLPLLPPEATNPI